MAEAALQRSGAAVGSRNFESRTLFHGDNLDFLRGLNSGTVNLIATDPPFNKSKDFHATPDSLAAGAQFHDRWSWRKDIHDDWVRSLMRDQPEVWQVIKTAKDVYGDDMGAFLCWLGVRLLEMHRVLADDGSIYLHIDHTAHAWVKCLMDAIFGKANFRNEIVWWYKNASRGKRQFAKAHDTLLWYTKSAVYTFRRDDILVPFESGMTAWRYSRGGQAGKEMPQGKTPDDVILLPSLNAMDKERTGYPTQKPLVLYEQIIKAASNEGDLVLDPFCGCATTCVVAERLGRQWVGMDIWDGAYEQVLTRLEKEGLAVPGKRRRKGQEKLRLGEIRLTTTPPKRTDSGETAALILQTPMGRQEKRHPPPRTQHGMLLVDFGPFCQGCGADYNFDRRVLEVDHVRPRSDGGTDAYDNLTLLCPPCNKEKRDYYTLTYLQEFNRKNGYMKNESNLRLGRAARRGRRRG